MRLEEQCVFENKTEHGQQNFGFLIIFTLLLANCPLNTLYRYKSVQVRYM